MANNRMYLLHKPTGEKVMIAKYYPSTGWYMKSYPSEPFTDVPHVNAFLDRVGKPCSLFGNPEEWALEFETGAEDA